MHPHLPGCAAVRFGFEANQLSDGCAFEKRVQGDSLGNLAHSVELGAILPAPFLLNSL